MQMSERNRGVIYGSFGQILLQLGSFDVGVVKAKKTLDKPKLLQLGA